MEGSEQQELVEMKVTEIKTFPVPFSYEEIIENKTISITTNASSKGVLPSQEGIMNQAFMFHSKGKFQEAAKYYKYLIKEGFNDYRVFSNYGAIEKGLGNLKEAELLLRRSIEIRPDCTKNHFNLGLILKDIGNFKEAELSLRKAIEIDPSNYGAYLHLANILKDLGKLKEAELSLRKTIELKPDLVNAHLNLGIILKDQSNLKEAEYYTRKAIDLKPDSPDAYNNLGYILKDIGNSNEVEACYSKALALRPNFFPALQNRWRFFFEKGDFKRALKDADSFNTESSKAFALISLYALGRIDEIYKRIDENHKLDNKNIRVAAFSSFISAQERKYTSNNFCPNPLSFLYFSNLKFHITNHREFIIELINELGQFETVWEPQGQSTYNGFQTPMNNNLFSNSTAKISQLQSIIFDELEKYFNKYEQEKCTYIKEWPSIKNLVGWHVILKKQGYQSAHIHPAGWLSGVIYLKVVPPLENEEGAIEFSLNGKDYFNVNSPKLTYQPQLGDIVLFPSSLHHRTIPFLTDTDRIVLAFDLMPN